MKWLNNLSIKYKLLLGFLIAILLMIPLGVFSIYSARHVEQSFERIVNLTFPRVQALLEIQNVVTQIQLLLNNCESDANGNDEAKTINCKNELLANIEAMNKWVNRYRQHLVSPKDSALNLQKLHQLQDGIIFPALQVITLQKDKDPKIFLKKEQVLAQAQDNLAQFVENSVNNESVLLEKTQMNAHLEINRIFQATVLSNLLAILFVICLSYFLANLIAKPIIRLNDFSKKISKDNLHERIKITSKDEIGQLAESINATLKNLSEANQRLITTAHQAGMAEVAASVLHNVGNVLNSINVSTFTLLETVKNSKLKNLPKVADLLEKNLTQLPTYLSTDEQGKQLPVYLIELAKYVDKEQASFISEINSLLKNIQHVKDIVTMQQTLSGTVKLVESASLIELVDEALMFSKDSLRKLGITLEQNYIELPRMFIDKVRLQQILVNLIKNAAEALMAGDAKDKKIKINLSECEDSLVCVQVVDNGLGIDKENITKIFTFGFTTKKNGHGIGLHSSALLAREMGGTLIAESGGLNKGATFTLKFPMRVS